MSLTFNHVYGFYRDPLVLRRLAPDEHDPVLTYRYLTSGLILQHANHGPLSSDQPRNLGCAYLDDPASRYLSKPRTLRCKKRIPGSVKIEHLCQYHVSNIEAGR